MFRSCFQNKEVWLFSINKFLFSEQVLDDVSIKNWFVWNIFSGWVTKTTHSNQNFWKPLTCAFLHHWNVYISIITASNNIECRLISNGNVIRIYYYYFSSQVDLVVCASGNVLCKDLHLSFNSKEP